MNAEYRRSSFQQRDRAEHEEYVGAQSAGRPEVRERDGADLLEEILDRDNLNRAFKRVRVNKGAPGIDGMTVEDALPWLKEHREELLESIRKGTFKPQPVRRKEIPKPDGGVRKLGIPTAVDRIIQQAIAQKLTPIYEPLFSDGSYFIKMSELRDRFTAARRAGKEASVLNGLVRPSCLIIDEVGHCEFDKENTRLFFDLIDRRYNKEGHFNIVFTSNKSPS